MNPEEAAKQAVRDQLPPMKGMAAPEADHIVLTAENTRTNDPRLIARGFGYDLTQWDIHRPRLGFSDVTMKLGPKKDQTVITRRNWNHRFEMKLKSREERLYPEVLKAVARNIRKTTPPVSRIRYKPCKDPVMLEIAPVDPHSGKYSWREQTGSDYNSAICRALLRDAFTRAFTKATVYDVEKILIILGHDFLHIDGPEGETTHGTRQDFDSRWEKLMEDGFNDCRDYITEASYIAPVEVVIVPGNHDEKSMYALGIALQAFFHNNPNITVDNRPRRRKYYRYGKVLLGFAHGQTPRNKKTLYDLMPVEADREGLFSGAVYREWHIGHTHAAAEQKREVRSVIDLEEQVTIRIRTLPSLSGDDLWHYDNAYLNTKSSAHLVWSPEEGCLDMGYFNPKPERYLDL
jgi:hypothetical protein